MKIKIFGNAVYDIKEVDKKDLENSKVFGHINYDSHIIEISNSITDYEKAVTLIHEIIHGAFFATGRYETIPSDTIEEFCSFFSLLFVDLLNNNRELLIYINEHLEVKNERIDKS